MTAYRGGLTPADVERAAERVARYTRRTPLLPGLPARGRRRGGWGLLLKAEHLQHSGSFKLRGAANAVLALGARALVTGSSGNHGIALARLAAPMGVRVTVVTSQCVITMEVAEGSVTMQSLWTKGAPTLDM
ncbi:pyridoxal-phosphate dependent enzyme, partial [Streptomyces sp. NPDC003090]|uniref:pyridoxal-phosphate dependent enzyme n=1 Tax=Streptomyces sp. NPDC003090 TaxID=3154274 RepID=UPI0037F4D0C9